MGTHSFYISGQEEKSIIKQLGKTAKEKGLSVSELVTRVIRDYLDRQMSGQKKKKGWAHEFCGSWAGNDADDIAALIQSNRTRQSNPSLS